MGHPVPIAQAGWWNIPNLSQPNQVTNHHPHPVAHGHVLHTEIWHGSVVLVEVVMVVEMLVMVLLRGRRSAAHAKHRSF